MTQLTVTVNSQGRVVVPAELRRELGITSGMPLVAYVEDGRLILEERAHMLKRLQDEFRAHTAGKSVVDELLAERRAEARSS